MGRSFQTPGATASAGASVFCPITQSRHHYALRVSSPAPCTTLDSEQIIESGAGELQEQQRALLGASGSLGGAKPKAAIAIDGEEWILKFFNAEPFDLPLVEHATMTLAHKAGIHVAQTLPIRLKGEHAVAVKRFDRK